MISSEARSELCERSMGIASEARSELSERNMGIASEARSELSERNMGIASEARSELCERSMGIASEARSELSERNRGIRPTIVFLGLFTLVCGVGYPLLVTVAAQTAFPSQANGSLVVRGDRIVGSALIGQTFDQPRYFWGRPSATSPEPYHAAASAASNLGPTNPALRTAAQARLADHPGSASSSSGGVPVDLVTTSASGLDPHLSPAAALYQVPRVAAARGLSEATVEALVREHVEGRSLRVLGEPRVNVLALNLALDGL